MGNTNEINKSNFSTFTDDVSSLDDPSKVLNFNGILNWKKSSGRSNSKGTWHVSGSNVLFSGTLFESKISFSKEHIISKVEVIFLTESIELCDHERKIFSFSVKFKSI